MAYMSQLPLPTSFESLFYMSTIINSGAAKLFASFCRSFEPLYNYVLILCYDPGR